MKPEFERDEILKNTLKYARIWTQIYQFMLIVIQLRNVFAE
jgi:hypothetical protein